MRAVRFVGIGRSAQITDVVKPEPGPGQVLIKIGGTDPEQYERAHKAGRLE